LRGVGFFVRAAHGTGFDGCSGSVFVGVAGDGRNGSGQANPGPTEVGVAIRDEFKGEKAAEVAATLPGTGCGAGAGIVASDAEQFELAGLKILVGADQASFGKFGGADVFVEAGDGAEFVGGLGGKCEDRMRVEAQGRLAGAALRHTNAAGVDGIVEAEVGNAVIVDIDGNVWPVDGDGQVGWGINDFGFGGLSEGEQSYAGGAGRGGVIEQAFIEVGR